MPLLIPGWAFWIPMTLMIYSLPGELQFCMFSLALAAWSLIMIFVADRRTAPSSAESQPQSPTTESPASIAP